jgi:hypothetical protein
MNPLEQKPARTASISGHGESGYTRRITAMSTHPMWVTQVKAACRGNIATDGFGPFVYRVG